MRTLLSILFVVTAAAAGEKELVAIRAVGAEGQGNAEAAAAWKVQTSEGIAALLPTLKAFQGANVRAANYLRSAVDAIVQVEEKAQRPLPAEALKAFAADGTQDSAARRIAFELFEKLQPAVAKEMLLAMIDDPSLDLRRDAIARRMEVAKDETALLDPLFTAARDRDQVEELAKKLKYDEAAVVKHFNFITKWHIAGPFDGPKASGFATTYDPEKGVDLTASYKGKVGDVTWKAIGAKAMTEGGDKDYALIDLAKELGKHKDAVAYAFAVVEVVRETPLEFRGATQNGVKFFVNGKSVFEREAYHQGTMMDQHGVPCVLKAGRNELLIKIAQNDQKEPWAQRWAFQARLCDTTGGAVPFTLTSPK